MTEGDKSAIAGGFKDYATMKCEMLDHLYSVEPNRKRATPDYLQNLLKFCNNIPFKDLPLYMHNLAWHVQDRIERLGITASDVKILVKWRLEHNV